MLLQSVLSLRFVSLSAHLNITIRACSRLLLGIWFENEALQPGLSFLSESRGDRVRDGLESTNRLRFAQGPKDRRQIIEG